MKRDATKSLWLARCSWKSFSKPHIYPVLLAVGLFVLAVDTSLPARAHETSPVSGELPANAVVLPFATLQLSDSLIEMPFPAEGRTESAGIDFMVRGNVTAMVSVEPDDFVKVGSRYLGEAVNGSDTIGYDVMVQFPQSKRNAGPVAKLPESAAGSTPPLEADLFAAGLKTFGSVYVVTDSSWVPEGGLPAPGIYVGHITLTLTADY